MRISREQTFLQPFASPDETQIAFTLSPSMQSAHAAPATRPKTTQSNKNPSPRLQNFRQFQATHTAVDDWETHARRAFARVFPDLALLKQSSPCLGSVSRSRSQTHTEQTDSQTDTDRRKQDRTDKRYDGQETRNKRNADQTKQCAVIVVVEKSHERRTTHACLVRRTRQKMERTWNVNRQMRKHAAITTKKSSNLAWIIKNTTEFGSGRECCAVVCSAVGIVCVLCCIRVKHTKKVRNQ